MIRTALVIGGGVAGPATAMALHKAGIDATVYEASTAPRGGAFLTLAPNGADALRVLDADGAALAKAFPSPAITLRSTTGKELGTVHTPGAESFTLRRADLDQALRAETTARDIPVLTGKRLVTFTETATGVRAEFADGTTAEADVLVGADGIHSEVRRVLDPAAPPLSYAGLVGNGGFAPPTGAVSAPPGHYEMIFGRRAFFGYVVAPGGEVWWFANVPYPREPARGELAAIDWRPRLIDLFEGDAGPAIEVISATPEFVPMDPIQSVSGLRSWHSRRVVLVGDAAHAPTPTSGQGASLSIEDGLVLAKCLRDHADPADAFARYESARRPRVERIIKAAARNNSSKAAGPVGRVIRDAVMPTVLKLASTSNAQRKVFDYHIDWAATA
ncbi:2-polyprenyl-6-methoxyphenol hydroxylase-like FAD-dependent oxidoreductase [Asanoa ferruginea]|uniref:2-polyprenyl-6-methoxyphenol hydroxylase-like FAD-dependent oxidoreductase n=1 Tax=Asanoa ferruginea TaxID=53367 RepID=A0A3D9ZMP7_9ACTN|nr:NAD(P)/FAD-dependent oxidoreductase [Asanoa ferruginea]REF94930.1 2-polyprenyl-6-methoxyphenol hydroxylase-like FAD-dependent oxidoreductase [Asanoa ferruginea]GIF45490.1 FAD-dependent oxidoreductase [Asanoa ferruginea]